MQIEWLKTKETLHQIYSSGFEFSLLGEENKQAIPFCFCKDYIQDYFTSQLHDKKMGIHGFSADSKIDPKYNFDNTNLIITNSQDNKLGDKIHNLIIFLNKAGKFFEIKKPVKIHKIENPQDKYSKCGVFCVTASKTWQIASPVMSLFTILCRLGVNVPQDMDFEDFLTVFSKKTNSNDNQYLKNSLNGIKFLKENKIKKVFGEDFKLNYPAVDIEKVHHSSGIVAFSTFLKNHKDIDISKIQSGNWLTKP